MFGGQNCYSDYGSGSSSNSPTSWPPQDVWAFQPSQHMPDRPFEQNSASYEALVTGKCTLNDIMKDFQMNGVDSQYTPAEDNIWTSYADGLSGLGPPGAYCRQTSWPAPERSPAPRLPRPRSEYLPTSHTPHVPADFIPTEFTSSTPVNELSADAEAPPAQVALSAQQASVLSALPNDLLLVLLQHLRGLLQKRHKKLAAATATECRFCKNNGERESYYHAHALKDASGRVTCPVLRAYVCARCGASGDRAHTTKYCPLATHDERMKSTAMMRSLRMASGRRRSNSLATSLDPNKHHLLYEETAPSVVPDVNEYNPASLNLPLDPQWAALAQKLM